MPIGRKLLTPRWYNLIIFNLEFIRIDVGDDPAWGLVLPEQLPPLPVEDSVNRFGHI